MLERTFNSSTQQRWINAQALYACLTRRLHSDYLKRFPKLRRLYLPSQHRVYLRSLRGLADTFVNVWLTQLLRSLGASNKLCCLSSKSRWMQPVCCIFEERGPLGIVLHFALYLLVVDSPQVITDLGIEVTYQTAFRMDAPRLSFGIHRLVIWRFRLLELEPPVFTPVFKLHVPGL